MIISSPRPHNCDEAFELDEYDMNNVYDDHDPSYTEHRPVYALDLNTGLYLPVF